jgi:hypothetical protein
MSWTAAFVLYLLSLFGVRDQVDEPSRQAPPSSAEARTSQDDGSGYHRTMTVLDISNGF